jgi:hypothetical protein
VKNRHRRPERNFEVVVGKVIGESKRSSRFAFVRGGGRSEGHQCVTEALKAAGADAKTSVTVLTDGDAGLREVQKKVLPGAAHILDWFHLAMRFQNLGQIMKCPLRPDENAAARDHAVTELERVKWEFWNGKPIRGMVRLVRLSRWACTPCFQGKRATKPYQERSAAQRAGVSCATSESFRFCSPGSTSSR